MASLDPMERILDHFLACKGGCSACSANHSMKPSKIIQKRAFILKKLWEQKYPFAHYDHIPSFEHFKIDAILEYIDGLYLSAKEQQQKTKELDEAFEDVFSNN